MRRDSGETYQEFLTRLAQASGIETPTRADLARVDRKRPKKGRNTDWRHPHDPDARITKMKDGRTHLAHKAEHAVDLETGAIVGVTVQGADQGDTTTIAETVTAAAEELEAVAVVTDGQTAVIDEVVADKGITAIRCWWIWGRSICGRTSPSQSRAAQLKKKTVAGMRCMPIAGASAARVGWLCSGGGANILNGRTHISTKPAACGGRMCAGMRTSSNACSSKQAPSTWAPHGGH